MLRRLRLGLAALAVGLAAPPAADAATYTVASSAGDIGAFQTAPPVVGPVSASDVSLTAATLHGTVDPAGMQIASCVFLYGPSTAYGSDVPCLQSPGAGFRTVKVSARPSSLKPGTTYHVLLRVISGGGTRQSADATFTTQPFPALSGLRVHALHVSYTDTEPSATRLDLLACNAFHKRRCIHYIDVGSAVNNDRRGSNHYSLRHHFRRAQLVPGNYLLKATPSFGPVAGKTVRATFEIRS
jgi:hypothetical protein